MMKLNRMAIDVLLHRKDSIMNDDSIISTLSAPTSRTLSDHVAEELRQAILEERLKPGQRIVERQVAQAMQTSRGPVRDALTQLENEGLVTSCPHRGTFVSLLTRQDAEEIYTLRLALETLAVDFAAKYATTEQLDMLDTITDEIAVQITSNYTTLGSTELDLQYHHTLCQISGHKRVLQAWEAMRAQTQLLILSHRRLQPERWREVGVEWHRQITTALRERDVHLAREVLKLHLTTTLETVLESFAKQESKTPVQD
jgi:DNA-binding GntR family transcriptional regulator